MYPAWNYPTCPQHLLLSCLQSCTFSGLCKKKKINPMRGMFLSFIAAMASPVPSSSFSVPSYSSVIAVAYYLQSTLLWILPHLQSLQNSVSSLQDDNTIWKGRNAGQCLCLSMSLSQEEEQFWLAVSCFLNCAELRGSADKTQGSAVFQPYHIFPEEQEGRKA